MEKICPLCEKEYSHKTQKCPKEHCPNCSSTNLETTYEYILENLLLDGKFSEGVAFFLSYFVTGFIFIYVFFYRLFDLSIVASVLLIILYPIIIITYNNVKEFESDRKPFRIKIGYKCNKCGSLFEHPLTNINLVNKLKDTIVY